MSSDSIYIARTTMVMTHGCPKQLENPVEDSEMWLHLQKECSQYCPASGENSDEDVIRTAHIERKIMRKVQTEVLCLVMRNIETRTSSEI